MNTGAIILKGTEVEILCSCSGCGNFHSEILTENVPARELDDWILSGLDDWDDEGNCPDCKEEDPSERADYEIKLRKEEAA